MHSSTQHNTTQLNSTAQHNATHPNTTQRNTQLNGTTQLNSTQHNTTQHNTTQHNTTQDVHIVTPAYTRKRVGTLYAKTIISSPRVQKKEEKFQYCDSQQANNNKRSWHHNSGQKHTENPVE